MRSFAVGKLFSVLQRNYFERSPVVLLFYFENLHQHISEGFFFFYPRFYFTCVFLLKSHHLISSGPFHIFAQCCLHTGVWETMIGRTDIWGKLKDIIVSHDWLYFFTGSIDHCNAVGVYYCNNCEHVNINDCTFLSGFMSRLISIQKDRSYRCFLAVLT